MRFVLHPCQAAFDIDAPKSQFIGCAASAHQSPIGIKASALLCRCPWRSFPPQKIIGTEFVPKNEIRAQFHGCRGADPIKSIVECGVGDDVDTVIVDGKVCMEGGVIPGVDFAALRDEAQRAGEAVWNTVAEWDPLGRTAEQASPWSFPLV